MAKPSAFATVVIRASAVTPRKQQISTVVTTRRARFCLALNFELFEAKKHVDCSHKRAQHIAAEIDFRKSRFSH
jgi:hypothetical protein